MAANHVKWGALDRVNEETPEAVKIAALEHRNMILEMDLYEAQRQLENYSNSKSIDQELYPDLPKPMRPLASDMVIKSELPIDAADYQKGPVSIVDVRMPDQAISLELQPVCMEIQQQSSTVNFEHGGVQYNVQITHPAESISIRPKFETTSKLFIFLCIITSFSSTTPRYIAKAGTEIVEETFKYLGRRLQIS